MDRESEEYLEASADRLFNIMEKKLKTSFIGALSSLENSYFGELWGHGKYANELNEAERKWRKVFDELRKEILDNGNKQIRDLDNELTEYTIRWNRKQNDIPVIETREEYDRYKAEVKNTPKRKGKSNGR